MQIGQVSMIAIASCFIVFLICYLIKRYEHLHAAITHDHDTTGIQKLHSVPVPRIGGIAIMAGLLVGFGLMAIFEDPNGDGTVQLGLLLMSAFPVFVVGIIEDLTKRVSVSLRLLFSFVSAGLAAISLDAMIHSLNISWLDAWFAWPPIAVAFTIFVVGGVPHSFNMIDGCNGLSAGVSLIVMTSLAYVAYLLGDQTVLMLSLFVGMAILGFFVWNWPRGLIFMGDGGAYLLGFLSAVIFLILLNRNPSVSPWFAATLLGYPIFETLYSIFRRTILLKTRHDMSDDRHMHQLIYYLINRVRDNDQGSWISNNSLTSLPIWFIMAMSAFVSVSLYDNTRALIWFCLAGILIYKLSYRLLLWSTKKSANGA